MSAASEHNVVGDENILELIASRGIGADVVRAFAGDVAVDEPMEARLKSLQAQRGRRFYSDLLYVVVHQNFSPDVAVDLWNEIQSHKSVLSSRLARNVGIVVAAVDYLTNVVPLLDEATVISARELAGVAHSALTDSLTGLFNRGVLSWRLEEELQRFERYGNSFSLILIDVDDFKRINDRYGHTAGDLVLCSIAEVIRRMIRETDISARYGGEEFVVITPNTGVEEAARLGERIRKAIHLRFAGSHGTTVSIGIAGCPVDARSARELIERADEALYASKRAGKDRVTQAGGSGRAGGTFPATSE